MKSQEQLNPRLYGRLERLFARVRVANPGQPAHVRYQPDWSSSGGRPRLKAQVLDWGETYYINCPSCNDTRGRLAICHLFGTRDKKTGHDMTHLAMCFNEECFAERAAQKQLHSTIFPRGRWALEARALPIGPPEPRPEPPPRYAFGDRHLVRRWSGCHAWGHEPRTTTTDGRAVATGV